MEGKFSEEDNVDFINLVLMLNQNALVSLGEASRFVSGVKKQNLPHARQSINMIKAIRDKTKGNLTAGESKLVIKILSELQAKYVKASGLGKPQKPPPAPPAKGAQDGSNSASPPEKQKSSDKGLNKALDSMSNDQLANILADLQKKSRGQNK
ncbi:MAG TPA: DUF1844 domain-containing protein [Spirochaetota bacterium]|nr:DUF1844 domain-containing protein [Spirochaetota bacterium]